MNYARTHPVVAQLQRSTKMEVCFLFLIFMIHLGNHSSVAFSVDRRPINANRRSSQEKASIALEIETTIRRAMQLSNSLANNITAAHEACDYWSLLLDDDESVVRTSQVYNDAVMALSLALYASCLVRIGQDASAVEVYTKALAIDPANHQVRLAKAQALQRLLQYQHARHEFQQVESLQGKLGEATCCLRLGDVYAAIQVLNASCYSEGSSTASLQGLLGTLHYLQNGSVHHENTRELIRLAANEQPLYRWIQGVLLPEQQNIESSKTLDSFLSLIKINTCPLDDPSLVRLDDKVWLHQLLVQHPDRTRNFWPVGYLVADSIQDDATTATIYLNLPDNATHLYFLKERSGYGSHGNTVLTTSEAMNRLREVQGWSGNVAKEKLLQRMIDPTLLLDGRKFSLRIYVIYFSPSHVYLSPHGLVKLASMKMEQGDVSVDPRLHMTNSGRDVAMEQHDLSYLRAYLSKQEGSFESLWKRISLAIEQVFYCYQMEKMVNQYGGEWEIRREGLGIPKIMGFDFVVDDQLHPWLVEINRFPGLEPRDNSDLAVKEQVVHDAWLCAAERVSTEVRLSFGLANHQHSLQRLEGNGLG